MPSNLYADWRQQFAVPATFHEESALPPERLLQAVWFHQRVQRDRLMTTDGRRLQILHPGFWNRESGPDFRNAVFQFNHDPPQSGDIEIDLQTSGWRAHRHDVNPAFRKVALHVVWEADAVPVSAASRDGAPGAVLVLRELLDSSISELAYWLGNDQAETFPEILRGQCCAPLRELSPEQLSDLLKQAALLRLQAKAAHVQARSRQVGWEQALWEGTFRALGYKQNGWPMQRLAELRDRLLSEATDSSSGSADRVLHLQSRLFGMAGLLPPDLTRTRARTDRYLLTVWHQWWRERETFADCLLPREVWKLHGLRPANHPQRRLALAAHWLAGNNFPARIEAWGLNPPSTPDLATSLIRCLRTEPDDYWSWHWTLGSKTLPRAVPLLGSARATDLAVNIILPWLWVRAREGRNDAIREETERRYFAWPPAEDNSVLRMARERLLGTSDAPVLNTASAQQGLVQIVRDFCEHSDSLCAQCRFPQLVRGWRPRKEPKTGQPPAPFRPSPDRPDDPSPRTD